MKKKSEWESPEDIPACPNNTRHGVLVPHPMGGLVCEDCQDEHTPRSRIVYRWADPR